MPWAQGAGMASSAAVVLSAAEARRIALPAQGFAGPEGSGPAGTAHLRTLAGQLRVLQIDPIGVLVRSQYLPAYSRLGPYPAGSLDALAYEHRELFEYVGHEWSLLPVDLHPLMRWRMHAFAHDPRWTYDMPAGYPEVVLAEVAERGPLTPADLSAPGRRSTRFEASPGKRALTWLTQSGRTAVAGRRGTQQVYDLAERVIPARVLAAPTPERDDARRELLAIAAQALGVATVNDLASYFLIGKGVAGFSERTAYPKSPRVARLVADLVEDGRLEPVTVDGWDRPAFLHPKAAAPPHLETGTLLSPFDSLIWDRDRSGADRTPVVHAFYDPGMVSEGTILHADLDAFYASVEQRDDPCLRGRPVIVGGGVVLAASYEAKAYGVRTAMGGRQARRLCPQAVVVQPRMSAYTEASRAVFEVFRQTTPVVEGLSIDEAFLEVAGLRRISGAPSEIAVRLRHDVRERVGLPITVGVARTKFLAKVASRVAKPDGLLVVPPDAEAAFLHPLPVELLWGVGPVTAAKLRDRRIVTVGQVARLGEPTLVSLLGHAAGRHLHALAHHQDPRPVRVGRRRASMGAQRALGRSRRSAADLSAVVASLVDRVTRRMRAAGRSGRTVVLRLRFDDFTRVTRSRTLPVPTSATRPVLSAVHGLLAAAMPLVEQRGITLIGVAVTNFDTPGVVQPTLPFDRRDDHDLDAALDAVRDRYGSAAITRAAMLGRDPGLSVPLLPD